LTHLFIEKEPEDWEKFLTQQDFPDSFDRIFSAIVASFTLLMLPGWIAPTILEQLVKLLEPHQHDFIIGSYMPEMVEALKDVKIPFYDSIVMARLFIGLIIKIVYAFLYQEEHITPDFLFEPGWISFGGHMIWAVNMIADTLSGQTQTDLGV